VRCHREEGVEGDTLVSALGALVSAVAMVGG
jgi:hypothetical protein